ncbi:hypothetical protein BU23DRAFT_629974 [Bimuria novae-zelandiae CBS 107.79]|uniref:Uncharacterized protein n=1 Tax=Bimuria novae-zelandiae CBS 107.79 TaxID=1447943 RepID=A0A6A5VKP4_9PLEO|nr:hypothetical protein BU23DRAFT_629974 [Bimuria novae-zelandiae CBS 107.79]
MIYPRLFKRQVKWELNYNSITLVTLRSRRSLRRLLSSIHTRYSETHPLLPTPVIPYPSLFTKNAIQIHSFSVFKIRHTRRRARPHHRRKRLHKRYVAMERRQLRQLPYHPPPRAHALHLARPRPGGVSFKISHTPQLLDGHHTQFEYAVADNILYYDILLVNCAKGSDASACPGHVAGLEITVLTNPSVSGCGAQETLTVPVKRIMLIRQWRSWG